MGNWQSARLIPVSGIDSAKEAETRAASALLAVLSIVRPFSKALFDGLGASRAQSATVEAFIEVGFDHDGKRVRPDGLIRVFHGTKAPWVALVEVKTNENPLEVEQVNLYWDIAREHGYDAVITISNEIAPAPGVHPTQGLKVRSNSRVQVRHFSWTLILAEAVTQKLHRGIEDPEQAWMLGELIRYLEHPASGAMQFGDMGPSWVAVRDAARDGTLSKRDEGAIAIAERWEQLMRYAALRLGADIGEDVRTVLRGGKKADPGKRIADLAAQLADTCQLDGALRVPNTAGDLEIVADLKAKQLVATIDVAAPGDRGARAQASWLVSQLADASPRLIIECWVKNGRTASATATLAEAREDRSVLQSPDGKETARFRIVDRAEMGMARKAGGKNPGFIDNVLGLMDEFYVTVVQNIMAWRPKAPRKQAAPAAETARVTTDEELAADVTQPAPLTPPGDADVPITVDPTSPEAQSGPKPPAPQPWQ